MVGNASLLPTLRCYIALDSILVLRLVGWHGVDAAEPAVEVDVGAAPRAERLELLHRGLLADRALRDAGRSFGHMVQIMRAAPARHPAIIPGPSSVGRAKAK